VHLKTAEVEGRSSSRSRSRSRGSNM
jgi:hypothetical protein